jgi:hypothetical protein
MKLKVELYRIGGLNRILWQHRVSSAGFAEGAHSVLPSIALSLAACTGSSSGSFVITDELKADASTSRTVVNRLLDSEDTGFTFAD